MKLAECELKSKSPYSQSKHYVVPKLNKELDRDYESRTWRERCHCTEDGRLFIPPMQFTNSLKEAARYLSLSIPGKRMQTFTKHFEAGVLVTDGLVLKQKKDEIDGEWLFVPSDGSRGGGRRVDKCFPLIHEWAGKIMYIIQDDIITEDVFRVVLETSGNLIGIGRFRPSNMGYYGRFEVKHIEWQEG